MERERTAVLKEVNLDSENLEEMDLSTEAKQSEVAKKLMIGMKMLEEEA